MDFIVFLQYKYFYDTSSIIDLRQNLQSNNLVINIEHWLLVYATTISTYDIYVRYLRTISTYDIYVLYLRTISTIGNWTLGKNYDFDSSYSCLWIRVLWDKHKHGEQPLEMCKRNVDSKMSTIAQPRMFSLQYLTS